MNDENKLREIFKEYNDEMKRHTGALLEDFQSQLSAVAEGVTMLNEKVDRIEQTQNLHTEILKSHSEILNAHTDKLDSHTEMIGGQMEYTSEIKIELENKVDKREFIDLKQTVLTMS